MDNAEMNKDYALKGILKYLKNCCQNMERQNGWKTRKNYSGYEVLRVVSIW